MRERDKTKGYIESFQPGLERIIDLVFLSTALIAPIALVACLSFIAMASPWWAGAMLLVAIAACVGIYARFVAAWRLEIRRLKIEDLLTDLDLGEAKPNARPFRVVFFSDMHLGQFKRAAWAKKVVDTVNAQEPDLVLIGGDFVGHTDCCNLPELFEPLRELRVSCGIFATLGNHDHGLPGDDFSEELRALLPTFGVRVLANECARVDEFVNVIGIEELWTKRDDFRAALQDCEKQNGITLVLGHNPDLMLKLTPEDVTHPKHTLFLFGHTHHGQIHLPFAPSVAIPTDSDFYRGVYRLKQGTIYVSSGTGETTTPTRLNAPPEIVVIDISIDSEKAFSIPA